MIDIIFHDETGMGSAFPAQADGFEKADGSGEIDVYKRQVQKSTVLKASFPLTYAECVKSEG